MLSFLNTFDEDRISWQALFSEYDSNTAISPGAKLHILGEPGNVSASFFYPRDAMLAGVIVIATCLSVCPYVTRRYCVKTKKASGMISSPSGSPKTLVLCRQISSPNSKTCHVSGQAVTLQWLHCDSLTWGTVGRAVSQVRLSQCSHCTVTAWPEARSDVPCLRSGCHTAMTALWQPDLRHGRTCTVPNWAHQQLQPLTEASKVLNHSCNSIYANLCSPWDGHRRSNKPKFQNSQVQNSWKKCPCVWPGPRTVFELTGILS